MCLNTNNVLNYDASSVFWFLAEKDRLRNSLWVTTKNNLRRWREAHALTTAQLGERLGISSASISRIETGNQQPREGLLVSICAFFAKTPSEFYEEEANIEPMRLTGRPVPILDYVQAGTWTGVAPQFRDEEMTATVMAGPECSPDTFALRIRGESMLPKFQDGDVVVIDPAVSPRPEDFVVAKDAGGEATFKRYHLRGTDPSNGHTRFDLVPLNPAYETLHSTEQPITIVGTMVVHLSYRKR